MEENVMKAVTAIVIAAGIALPFAAFAQMSDADYCNKLSATYRSVVAGNATPDATVPEAMSKCSTDPKSAIPILEKVLKDNKVTLPSRS
jgi:hypothetical protein